MLCLSVSVEFLCARTKAFWVGIHTLAAECPPVFPVSKYKSSGDVEDAVLTALQSTSFSSQGRNIL
jgi:hypothetical protein